MKRLNDKSGYSILELMIVLAIFGLIMSSLAFSFIQCCKLFNITMSEAELALSTRALRDKLLFHSQMTSRDAYYSGLLSGTNVTVVTGGSGNARISMVTEQVERGKRPSQRIDINTANIDGNAYLANIRETMNAHWLMPGTFKLRATDDFIKADLKNGKPVRLYINLSMEHEIAGGMKISHSERVVVPVFQRYQPKWTGEGATP